MMRVLVMIAVSGFLLCVVCISGAVAIGGPDAIERGVWNWGSDGDWDWHWSGGRSIGHHHFDDGRRGPQETRTLTWTGGDTLDVSAPADVTFTQTSGPASVTVSGPSDAVDAMDFSDGRLESDNHHLWRFGHVKVVMSAPNVSNFILSGAGRLDIEGYNRDDLSIDVSGAGDIRANGTAKHVKLAISGTGAADASGLKNEAANVDISGMGHARIAPTAEAHIDVSGIGDVTLLSKPPVVESHISGMGHVNREGD